MFYFDGLGEPYCDRSMDFLSWKPDSSNKPISPVPLTALSGFLGAGKTTVLNKILSASASQKFVVIVNDLGEVNIDAALIKSAVNHISGPISGMIELQGGCICCTIQTDLLDALLELWQQFDPEHILIEATGVAEPEAILETLYTENIHGFKGVDFVKVANMVTVIDSGNFEQYIKAPNKRKHLLQSDPRRPIEELLMGQIECADVLLVNKVDLLEEEALQRFKTYLKKLNYSAEIRESSFGDFDIEWLMQEQRFGVDKTLKGAAWWHEMIKNEGKRKNIGIPVEDGETKHASQHSHSHGHHHPHHSHDHDHHHTHGEHDHHHDHKDYGLETFVFNARKPFVESRFLSTLRTGLPGVIRAKGFYWTERVPLRMGLLSIAGKTLRADYLSEWLHTRVERGEVDLGKVTEVVHDAWLPEYGDRRQEIVFIGIDLDRGQIKNALVDCFVKEEVA